MASEVQSFVNWLGQTISVGDTIVYPAMSGRSCQMTEGVVLKIGQLTPAGVPTSLSVKPTGRNSRYSQHWGGQTWDREAKKYIPNPNGIPAVNLSVNARSVVKAEVPECFYCGSIRIEPGETLCVGCQ